MAVQRTNHDRGPLDESSTTGLVHPGRFHRLAVAAGPEDGIRDWLCAVLGARPQVGGMHQVHGLPMPGGGEGVSDESGARSEIVWIGGTPFCVIVPTDERGPLGQYVARHGSGLHSVAWTVDDLWATEARLRQHDVRITGVDIAGRHFFMHPRDSAGLLVEWTDTDFDNDPRDGATLPQETPPVVFTHSVPWFTLLVDDILTAARRLPMLMSARSVTAAPQPDPTATSCLDLAIGDAVIRLVTPLTGASPYSTDAPKTPRLHSVAIGLPGGENDLDKLQRHGVDLTHRDGDLAWSDPSSTAGLRFEWVLEPPVPQ